jgi:peptide deformylase
MSLLGIHVLGSPVLRQATVPVTVFDDGLRRLIDDMFETMYAAHGIGLAAPQVGRTERLAVIDVDREHPFVIINPEIVARDGVAKAEEGCLSIPEIYADVERPALVTIRARDETGALFEIEADELLARCLQHEIDHLDGKLFIDYLSVLKKRAALAKWEDEKKQYPALIRTVVSPSEVAEHHHDQDL